LSDVDSEPVVDMAHSLRLDRPERTLERLTWPGDIHHRG